MVLSIITVGLSLCGAYKAGEKEKDKQQLIEVRRILSSESLTGEEYAKKTEDLKKDFKYLNEDSFKLRAIIEGTKAVYHEIMIHESNIHEWQDKDNLADYIEYRVYAGLLDWKDTKDDYFKNISCITRMSDEELDENKVKGTIVKEIEISYSDFMEGHENKSSVILFFVEKTGDSNG